MSLLKVVDAISEWSGRIFAWLAVALPAVVVYGTLMRYLFHKPPIWTFEMTVFIYAALFLLGMAYTLLHDAHARIDVFVVHAPLRMRLILDIFSYLVFFFPFVVVVILQSIDFAAWSWVRRETSFFPWHPPVYPVKTIIPVAFFLLFLQGLADFIRKINLAIRGQSNG